MLRMAAELLKLQMERGMWLKVQNNMDKAAHPTAIHSFQVCCNNHQSSFGLTINKYEFHTTTIKNKM